MSFAWTVQFLHCFPCSRDIRLEDIFDTQPSSFLCTNWTMDLWRISEILWGKWGASQFKLFSEEESVLQMQILLFNLLGKDLSTQAADPAACYQLPREHLLDHDKCTWKFHNI
jgi:hypothetical protein